MTKRADLLALTEDALVSLTNRGLYKRAAKETAAGTGPTIAEDADAIRGTFPDGVVCALPPGGLEAAACTCGASGACRHVVAVVLAYQAAASDGTDEFDQWSPSEFTDEDLEALLGKRNFTTACRRHATGYLARVHPPDGNRAGPPRRTPELLSPLPGPPRPGLRPQRRPRHEGGRRARGVGLARVGGAGRRGGGSALRGRGRRGRARRCRREFGCGRRDRRALGRRCGFGRRWRARGSWWRR